MNEPAQIAFRTDQAFVFALTWMRKNYSELLAKDPEKYHEKLGFLADFTTDLFDGKISHDRS